MRCIKFLLVAILMFLSIQSAVWANNKSFQGNLELEDQLKITSNQLSVIGWAIHTKGIKQIRIYLDDKLRGEADYGLKREDVAKVYPAVNEAKNSGYRMELDLSDLKPGTHTISVEAVSTSDESTILAKKHIFKPEPPRSEITSPKEDFSTVKGNDLHVNGWIDGKAAVKSIQVWLDDHFVENAHMGTMLQDDQVKTIPNLPRDSGFEYNLDITKVYKGTHTIKIIAEMKDGTTIELGSKSFQKAFNYPMLILLFVFVLIGTIYYRYRKGRKK
ncbi:hypothetical protein ACFPYJ_11890 [Paenibacillus solisilvae]|uniref:Uncharacterized protein n=1 Tax=Paenibacillus solisilvae TaxID=2486751 RepID=A0ABW0W063_9BACL